MNTQGTSPAAATALMPLTIGVDIGGTNCEIGFVGEAGHCINKIRLPTLANQPFHLFVARFLNAVHEQLAALGSDYHCRGMGIAMAGVGLSDGRVRHATNFMWQSVNILKELRPHFNFPIHVINDANAAAIGEKVHGIARDYENFIVMTLGTGLGGGIFINGKPLTGSRGLAGELGHMEAVSDGHLCGCGRRGCLETYVSATGICRTLMGLVAKHGNRHHRFLATGFQDLSARAIWEAALEGDPLAIEAFHITGSILGRKMADLVAIFDPQAFILFGGLTQAGDLLMEPVKQSFAANLGTPFQGEIPIHISGVPHNEAAILGACHILDFS